MVHRRRPWHNCITVSVPYDAKQAAIKIKSIEMNFASQLCLENYFVETIDGLIDLKWKMCTEICNQQTK